MLIPPSPLVAQRSTRASFGSSSGDDPMLANLKRENETLKKRLAELSQKRKSYLHMIIHGVS